ncbi:MULTISPECIES: cupin [Mumia]|uniref:cupin n=1 Tax=Mumia TaxID=1546255 RepID=UPI00141DCB1E|nr:MULTISPECIES: cupin [unclassified Mumia]QMW66229.1 cupin [Mumia sp. ZJ1417]
MRDVAALTEEYLEAARAAPHGRGAELVLQDGPLRQSVLGLAEGAVLAEHDAPPAGSVLVLRGAIEIVSRSGTIALETGMLAEIPRERHSVRALVDSAFLLTAVTDI